jgi:hypothetical protein
MPSEIAGTGALWIALIAAISIALARPPTAAALRAACGAALATLVMQALHFSEEYATEFYRLFPERLGLAPWTATFFLVFNVTWLALWLLAIGAAYVARASLYAAIVLWFLAIAAIGNGIAHPLLALSSGGYFPGFITAPFLGVAGFILARRLVSR